MAAVLSAVVVFLVAGVVALALRQLHRRQPGKQPGQQAAVNISQVSAPGFEAVRSSCAEGQDTDGAAQPSE